MLGYFMGWIKVFNLTTFLAVWGALLSSITFGWALYKDLRDKAKIKVTASLRRIGRREVDGAYYMSEPSLNIVGSSEELFVVVSVVNIGRRRMNWKGLAGTYRHPVNEKKGFIVSARFLPKILEEQEGHDEFTDLNDAFMSGNVKTFFVSDGAGRRWNISRKDLKRIASDAKKYTKDQVS